ncbi:MAG: PAS domain S-box protein [Nitrospirae bacterium]|nr:PAS domain S-box protein [Nitrospirota bacterium]
MLEKSTDVALLNKAFSSFNAASASLVKYYRGLEERIKELDLELEEKNRELISSLLERDEIKNYLGSILQSLHVGVVMMDMSGKITIFNKAAETITGTKLPDVIGRRINDIFTSFHLPGSPAKSRPKRVQGTVPTPYTLHPTPSEEAGGASRKFYKKLGQHQSEISWTRRDGERLVLSLLLSDVTDFQGNPVGSVLLINDITEVRRFREQAERNSRLRAMGEMSVRIAHDLRNPLGSIELFASILKKEINGDRDKADLLDHISLGIKSMDRLISNLLFFTRPQKPIFKKTDINRVVEDSILFSSHLINGNNIEVNKDLLTNGMEIFCDEELMKQVFLNMILNAVQSMPEGGKLSIALERKDDKGEIRISVADTGGGIRREYMDKIFDPFFTTRDRGTGLGLAIVHNIVQAHDGTIEVESYPNRGSRFIIRMPSARRQRIYL